MDNSDNDEFHLNKSERHGDHTEAEVGDRQVGNKYIPENLALDLWVFPDGQRERESLLYLG